MSEPWLPGEVVPESRRGWGWPSFPGHLSCTWMVSCRTVYSGSSFSSWTQTRKGP